MSFSKSKFLLDENVRGELDAWLRNQGADAARSPKGAVDETLAGRSRAERRIIVTNDEDFARYDAKSVFGVVWLRLPQNDPQGLTRAFAPLLAWPPSKFQGKLDSLVKTPS